MPMTLASTLLAYISLPFCLYCLCLSVPTFITEISTESKPPLSTEQSPPMQVISQCCVGYVVGTGCRANRVVNSTHKFLFGRTNR